AGLALVPLDVNHTMERRASRPSGRARTPGTPRAKRQKLGCPASLHDHIRNDVAVRSMAGSVVLYDCMLSRYTATCERSNAPSFPLNFLNVSAPFAGHKIMPSTTPEVA